MAVKILVGDCRARLAELADKSVQTVVTSPPYFGLRDYGHDNQIGQEQKPDEFVQVMVDVFRDVRRVLADDGTVWLNLGDSYARSWGAQGQRNSKSTISRTQIANMPKRASLAGTIKQSGLKPKDLIGIPWRVALALQADGWFLRQDIIWSKPNPMPESVRDRCTKSHEYIFLLSKSERYYFDSDAIAEPAECGRLRGSGPMSNPATGRGDSTSNGDHRLRRSAKKTELNGKTKDEANPAFRAIRDMRNKRSVWTVTTKSFAEAHFATFPPELIEPCILAGAARDKVVLDPFGGAGTTALVADRLGRSAVLIEINPKYAVMARNRLLRDGGLLSAVELVE